MTSFAFITVSMKKINDQNEVVDKSINIWEKMEMWTARLILIMCISENICKALKYSVSSFQTWTNPYGAFFQTVVIISVKAGTCVCYKTVTREEGKLYKHRIELGFTIM